VTTRVKMTASESFYRLMRPSSRPITGSLEDR
jgi:hypothetical protein